MDFKLGTYEHYKGGQVKAFQIARHSETLEKFVVYEALYECRTYGKGSIWIRPLNMFKENVEIDDKLIPRFKFISSEYNMDFKPELYEHYKGHRYEVLGIVNHSETLDELVLYKALYRSEDFGANALWVRPKNMFFENIIIDGKEVPRFKYIK